MCQIKNFPGGEIYTILQISTVKITWLIKNISWNLWNLRIPWDQVPPPSHIIFSNHISIRKSHSPLNFFRIWLPDPTTKNSNFTQYNVVFNFKNASLGIFVTFWDSLARLRGSQVNFTPKPPQKRCISLELVNFIEMRSMAWEERR